MPPVAHVPPVACTCLRLQPHLPVARASGACTCSVACTCLRLLSATSPSSRVAIAGPGRPELQDVEAFAAALPGPLFVKYNAVLRGIKSDVPVLRRQMLELCCARADFEAFTSCSTLCLLAVGAHNSSRTRSSTPIAPCPSPNPPETDAEPETDAGPSVLSDLPPCPIPPQHLLRPICGGRGP